MSPRYRFDRSLCGFQCRSGRGDEKILFPLVIERRSLNCSSVTTVTELHEREPYLSSKLIVSVVCFRCHTCGLHFYRREMDDLTVVKMLFIRCFHESFLMWLVFLYSPLDLNWYYTLTNSRISANFIPYNIFFKYEVWLWRSRNYVITRLKGNHAI